MPFKSEKRLILMKIAIVNSSSFGNVFPKHLETLKKYGEVNRFDFPISIPGKELAEALKGHEIIISSVTPFFKEDFFAHKDKTILISRHGIGYNNIDVNCATQNGVAVTIVSALVEQEAVAENAASLMLSLLRCVAPAFVAVKENRWAERASFMGSELKGKTFGVIGFGNIGSRVGEIFKHGFQTRLLAYDPYIDKSKFEKSGAEAVDLDTLLRESDFISLNSKVTDETRHMLNQSAFKKMKQGVYIVNTARGELCDEDALVWALEKGKISGIAMDVIEGEPIDNNHRLLSYKNVLITPHTSAYTYECLKGMGDKVVSDVENILQGRTLVDLLNPSVFDK